MQNITNDNVNNEQMIDLSHYTNLLRKNWLSIILFSILVTFIAVLMVLQIAPKYTAHATLLIEEKEKKAVSFENVVGLDALKNEYYQTQYEILRSNQIAEKVIKQLGLNNNKEFNSFLGADSQPKSVLERVAEVPFIGELSFVKDLLEKKAQSVDEDKRKEEIRQSVLFSFKDRLKINPIKNTQLVEISFTSENPQLAANVANAVGYAYIEYNLDSRLASTQYASSWITSRLAELKTELIKSESALANYLQQEKLIDDSGIDALASQELGELVARLTEVRDKRIETESAYDALKTTKVTDLSTLASIPMLSQHPQVIAVRQAELDAQNDVNELSKRYGPKHDKMKAAVAKLESVRAQAEATTKKLISGIGKELEAARKQEALILATIQERKKDFQQLSLKRTKYDALKREVETNREILDVFLTKQKETTATIDFNATNANFTDKALVPQYPSAPKKKIIVVLAAIASLSFSVMLIFIIDILKSTIESAKIFEEKFGIIPIGTLPAIKSKRFRKQALDNSIFFDEQQMTFSESINSVRTSLMIAGKGKDKKCLAVTSSLPSEGKTTTAINLAQSFAKVENVLLIDCDLRKSSIAERFGFKKYHQGLSNYLQMNTELSDCIIKDENSNLSILPAGIQSENPQELLSSKKFEQLISHLETKYDRIIIDTPPCLPLSDSLVIGKLATSMLVIIKANSTKDDAIKKLINKLTTHGIVIEGFVINQVSQKIVNDSYSYGSYGEYYGKQNY
jgi:polysaccharide biosynthesis transport protein